MSFSIRHSRVPSALGPDHLLTGTVPPSNLGTGTRDGTKFLRDDGAWVPAPSAPPFSGALVRRTANFTISTTALFAITWQQAVYDTDAYWDAGAPTALTVPADGYYVASAGVAWSGTATLSGIYISTNSTAPQSGQLGSAQNTVPSTASAVMGAVSAPMFLTAGTPIYAGMYVNAQPRTLVNDARTWFAVHRVG